MTVEGECRPIDPDGLLERLKALLAEGGAATDTLNADAFWEFVAAVAQGRGIVSRLHGEGLEAVRAVNPYPASSRNERERRAYHIGLLARLLIDVGGLGGRASVLPGNFSQGAIVSDLLSMLGGPGGMGEAEPQILSSGRGGMATLRRHARRIVVGVVIWRSAREGKSQAEVRRAILADLEKRTWDRWLHELGGASGEFAVSARQAGEAGETDVPWSICDEALAPVIELAMRAQGRQEPE